MSRPDVRVTSVTVERDGSVSVAGVVGRPPSGQRWSARFDGSGEDGVAFDPPPVEPSDELVADVVDAARDAARRALVETCRDLSAMVEGGPERVREAVRHLANGTHERILAQSEDAGGAVRAALAGEYVPPLADVSRAVGSLVRVLTATGAGRDGRGDRARRSGDASDR